MGDRAGRTEPLSHADLLFQLPDRAAEKSPVLERVPKFIPAICTAAENRRSERVEIKPEKKLEKNEKRC